MEYIFYIIIPIISAIVGWLTNLIAIKMMFYPIEYFGLRPFGWQGIVPNNAAKMANDAVELMTEKLLDIQEIFSRIDSKTVSENLQPSLKQISQLIIDEVMLAQAPFLWKHLDIKKKNILYEKVQEFLPSTIERTMTDIKNEIKELIDFKKLAIDSLIDDKTLINRIFLNVGSNEFGFIEKSGLILGFIFGLIQMFVLMYFNDWWIFITGGIVIGFLTNFLALKMIFRPIEPIKFLGMKIQGLFLKRQKDVAKEYSKIITENILTTEQLFDAIFKTSKNGKIRKIINNNVSLLINKIVWKSKFSMNVILDKKRTDIIKNIATYRFMQELPIAMQNTHEYAFQTLKLRETIENKMANLPNKEFISFLRPVFQQDEWKLIIVGAYLGGIAGLIQFLVFILK